MNRLSYFLLMMALADATWAQQFTPPASDIKPSAFNKKFYWGLAYTQSWSTIKGSTLPRSYFSKPSVGATISVEYYPLSFLGVSVGAGYQQRGAGVKNSYTPGLPDSTYRERLRFNTFELPISLLLRTPRDIIKGLRLGGSIGIVPIINRNSRDSKISVEPNVYDLDNVKDVSNKYFKNDFAIQLAAGPEIDMAASQVIKIHFYYSQGTANVYSAGQGSGHNQNLGIRISWMF